MKKKYYAITAEKTYSKTVLVPIESVNNIEEAVDLVADAVDNFKVDLDEMEPEYDIYKNEHADTNGIREINENESALYQILCL